MTSIRAAVAWLRTRTGVVVVTAMVAAVGAAALDLTVLAAVAIVLIGLAVALVAASLGAVARGLQHAGERAGRLEHRSAAMNQRIANARSMFTQRMDAEAAKTDADHRRLEALTGRVEADRRAAAEEMDGLRGRIDRVRDDAARHDDKVIDRLRRLEVRVTQLDRDVGRELAAERSTRSLLLARRSAVPALDRVVVMMTLHRSGSTRLYDLVRSHPAVVLDPSMRTWDALDWTGRRYPAALSDRPDGRVPIEVDHGVGALVPESETDGGADQEWIIEKGHPQFVDFDPDRFATAIERLRSNGVAVEVVYGVRAPVDAMWSMVSYQQRDPKWYAFIDTPAIPDWIARSLEAMVAMRSRVDGLVVDYAAHDDPSMVRALAERLSPTWTDADIDRWTGRATASLDPAGRADGGGVFVGGAAGDRDPHGPDGVWVDEADVVERAVAAYEALLGS